MALEVTAVAMLLQIRCALMWHDPLMSCMARTKASLFVKNLKLWNCSSLKCVCLPYLCAVYVFFSMHIHSMTCMKQYYGSVCVCMWNIASEAQQQNDDLRFDKLMSFNAKNGSSFTAHDVVLPSRAFTVASVAVAEKGETTTSPGCPPASLGDKHNT